MDSALLYVLIALAVLVVGGVTLLLRRSSGRSVEPRARARSPARRPSSRRPRAARLRRCSSRRRAPRPRGAPVAEPALETPEPTAVASRGCAPGSRGRTPRSARACSRSSRATSSTTRRGTRSRRRCSPPTSASVRPQELMDSLKRRTRVESVKEATRGARDAARGAARAGRPDDGPGARDAHRRRAARPSCSSSASTAPARPRRPASSRGCSSPTAAASCSVLPTRSAPPRAEQLQTWGDRVGADGRPRARGRRPGRASRSTP